MDIILSNFFYYFSVTGARGGLHSMECKFEPSRTPPPDTDEMKHAVRVLVERYTHRLDELYGGLIEGEKQPTMTDVPAAIRTGYRYKGRLPSNSIPVLPERLRALFDVNVDAPCGEPSTYEEQRVGIECVLHKHGNRFRHFDVHAKFEMSHMLTVCFFHFTERMEGLVIGDEARASMEQLRHTLQNFMERKDTDYYGRLIGG